MPTATIPRGSNLTQAQLGELEKVFNSFDVNHDGTISSSEFKRAVHKVDYGSDGSSEEIALDILRSVDADDDGRVTFQEFVDAVAYRTNARGESTEKFRGLVQMMHKFGYANSIEKSSSRKTYISAYGCFPPPVIILIITIIDIIVFAVFSARECGGAANLECPISFSSELAFRPGCREEVWRFLTYAVVHASVSHIVFNTILQVVVGVPLEMVHGPLRVFGVYILGALAGSCASSVFDTNANLVGASAAVYALAGAHVADTFLNWAEMPFRWLRAGILAVLIIADLTISIYNRYHSGSGASVSYSGHLAGFLLGCTLGTVILKNLEGHRFEKIVGYVGIAIGVGGFIFAIFFNIFYDYTATSCPRF